MASKDRLTIEERALTLLANKEKEIEALKREVADKAEAASRTEGKLKSQLIKLKSMIKPLGNELVDQKEELAKVKAEVKACQEEVSNKNRLISSQKEELASMEIKSKEAEEKLEVEKEKVKALEIAQAAICEEVKSLQAESKTFREASLLLEKENQQSMSNAMASEEKVQKLKKELHQSEKTVTALNAKLQIQTNGLGSLKNLEDSLKALNEMLTFVKLECSEVKRENRALAENLKRKQHQLKELHEKLPRKRRCEKEETEEGEVKPTHDVSGLKRAKVEEQIVQNDEASNCINNESKEAILNTLRGETDVETSFQETGVETELTAVEPGPADGEAANSGGEGTAGVGMLTAEDAHMPIPSTSFNLPTSYNLPDIEGSPPHQHHMMDTPPSSECGLRLRDLNSLVESSHVLEVKSRDVLEQIRMDREMSLKHEMKDHVEEALRKHYLKSQPEMYSQRSWELFDDGDFAEVCRMVSVQAREQVLHRWEVPSSCGEDLWILEEDIIRMRESVDRLFFMREVEESLNPASIILGLL